MWTSEQIDTFVHCIMEMSSQPGQPDGWAESPAGSVAVQLVKAWVSYQQLADADRQAVDSALKAASAYMTTKLTLKTRKKITKRETKKRNEKEKQPPTPPVKEKEIDKEKEKKKHTYAHAGENSVHEDDGLTDEQCLELRRGQFREECLRYIDRYDQERLADFFNYWSEDDGKAMRLERQRFFNVEKRLARWMQNHISSEATAAALRLSKAKGRQQSAADRQQAAADTARRAAAEREAQREARERQQEADRQTSMTTAEYVSQNPDSLMARIARERQQRQQQKGGRP